MHSVTSPFANLSTWRSQLRRITDKILTIDLEKAMIYQRMETGSLSCIYALARLLIDGGLVL
jgi:hypothetical protein